MSSSEFTVSLSVDGDGCGLDEKISEKLIRVVQPEEPVSDDVVIESGSKATLNAQSSTGNVYWFDDIDGSEILHMGNQFISDVIDRDTSFYSRSAVTGEVSETGADLDESLNNGLYSSSNLGLIFDML